MADKSTRRRTWTYGSSTVFSTVIFLAILGVIALIAQRHPMRVDLTESGSFSLSEQTRNILKSLDKPVAIKAFFATASPEQTKAKDLLDTYRYNDKDISYEFIDPDRQPEEARRYDVRNYGTIIVEGYGKRQTIQTADEQSITNAILKLSQKEEKKIYFLQGHGEQSLNSSGRDGISNLYAALQKDNYHVEELNLMRQEQVPKDAAVVIIDGPQKNLMNEEIDRLKSYIDKGGKLIVLLNPYQDAGLRDFLKSYGIELKDDIVVDQRSIMFGSALMPLAMQYGQHRITENFNIATLYPEARSVNPAKNAHEGVHVQALASTAPDAWAETDLNLLKSGEARFDEKQDTAGPVPLVVISEITPKENQADKGAATETPKEENQENKEKDGYLLVAGDSDFINNTYFGFSGNGDLFLNMVNFMAEEESLITIESREKASRPLMMTPSQGQLLFWTVLVLVPLAVVVIGLGVYRVRRAQR